MAKTLDMKKSVYELTEEYPEVIDIMAHLGFTEIAKKPMRLSVGKVMTIPKGSKMKGIPMGEIVEAFKAQGFEVTGLDGHDSPQAADEPGKVESESKESTVAAPEGNGRQTTQTERTEQLKGYLRRLGDGESLESVRADFAGEFAQVDASEIMNAEQELLDEGTPLAEVQRLCDVHSALFHGSTAEEMLARAQAAVDAALPSNGADHAAGASSNGAPGHALPTDRTARAAELERIPGHPLSTLTRENEALGALIAQFRETRDAGLLPAIREVAVHYAKKGDLLYPVLKVNYNITGPSQVMWTVDDEIRDELAALTAANEHDEAWNERVDAVLQRAEEMVYKEQNILFAVCAANFTEDEWHSIYRDSKDYATCLGVRPETWDEAETPAPVATAEHEGEVVMPGGHLSVSQLRALLNTIPMEITFVDEDNINRFFNEGPKDFKRPGMAIDREVFSCHPPKVEPMVRQIIADFRSGARDEVPVWMEKNGHTMLVRYMAVRDIEGNYVGTAEFVQNMDFAKEHFANGEA